MSNEEWLATKRQRDVPWMSDDQWECYLMVAELFGGFHHMNDKPKPWGRGIKLSESVGRMATYDFDLLTELVFKAHDNCIRVELNSSSPGLVGIVLHKRNSRVGCVMQRHPTIEEALVEWRKKNPSPRPAPNEYGLDVAYFKGKLEQILSTVDRYSPGEMMRSLQQLTEVASGQANLADEKRITEWNELPNGTEHGRCPDGAGAKRIAVRRRSGEVNIWTHAQPGPDWMHGHTPDPNDIMAWKLLGEPR